MTLSINQKSPNSHPDPPISYSLKRQTLKKISWFWQNQNHSYSYSTGHICDSWWTSSAPWLKSNAIPNDILLTGVWMRSPSKRSSYWYFLAESQIEDLFGRLEISDLEKYAGNLDGIQQRFMKSSVNYLGKNHENNEHCNIYMRPRKLQVLINS